MADNKHFKVLEKRVVSGDEKGEPFDMGAYKTLQVQTRIIEAGNEGTIDLEHSATLEEGGFDTPSTWTSVNLTATGATANNFQSVTGFLRYVRFATSAAVSGTPVVCMDVIAKEH